MKDDLVLGINEGGLDTLALDIATIADNVSVIFDMIDEKYQTLGEYLKCNSIVDFNEKYESIRKNYNIIKENILSYSNDMLKVKTIVQEGSNEVTSIVDAGSSDIKSMEREVI